MFHLCLISTLHQVAWSGKLQRCRVCSRKFLWTCLSRRSISFNAHGSKNLLVMFFFALSMRRSRLTSCYFLKNTALIFNCFFFTYHVCLFVLVVPFFNREIASIFTRYKMNRMDDWMMNAIPDFSGSHLHSCEERRTLFSWYLLSVQAQKHPHWRQSGHRIKC